jgi:hypothetical protein
MTRIFGPSGSGRRRRSLFGAFVSLLLLSLLIVPNAFAVHDTGAFELDGNATNDPAVAGDDWDNVCFQVTVTNDPGGTIPNECVGAGNTSGATAVSWTAEPNPNFTIFTGGGSKDPQDVNQWAWKNAGGLPDKDNLLHSFATRYSLTGTLPGGSCPNGTGIDNSDPPDGDTDDPGDVPFDPAVKCEVLYFGSDRFDNSGDAQQGFWFFQNRIGLGTASLGGGTVFTGVHKTGDLLVISDFSNGGTVSTISVYRWNPAVSGNLELLDSSSAANCATASPGDPFCGLVNPGPGLTTSPWSFTDKSGNHNFLNGEFYEGGVNLSQLGLAGECFSSVASETRSSTSTTATLKDFILGQFAQCVPGMTTQASATVANPVLPGAPVHDTATITVTGGTNPADATGTVTFFLCGPIASGDCGTGGTNVGTGALVGGANTTDGISAATSPDVNTAASPLAAGRYCFRAEWPGDTTYPTPLSFTNSTDECFAVKDTSSISTAQNWLPNDSAHVTTGSGAAASGTVTFTLHAGADCTGTVLATFANRPVDASGNASTNNTTLIVAASPDKTISWEATFTPSDPNAVGGSTSHCETSTVTIDDDITV